MRSHNENNVLLREIYHPSDFIFVGEKRGKRVEGRRMKSWGREWGKRRERSKRSMGVVMGFMGVELKGKSQISPLSF